MLLIIVYYLFSGAIFYFMFKFLEQQSKKIDSRKIPKIFGSINLVLGIFFLGFYFIDPAAFSPEVTIDNQLVYIFMAIFSIYFYLLAPAISTGNLVFLYKQKYEALINKKEFYLRASVNLIAVFCFGVLTYQLFG